MLVVPVGVLADRRNRVRMVTFAAMAWGSMTILTGLSGFVGAIGLLVHRPLRRRPRPGDERAGAREPARRLLPARSSTGRSSASTAWRTRSAACSCSSAACSPTSSAGSSAFILLAVPTFIAAMFVSRLARAGTRRVASTRRWPSQLEEEGERISVRRGAPPAVRHPDAAARLVLRLLPRRRLVPIAVFFTFFFEKVYGVESATARRRHRDACSTSAPSPAC